MIRFNDSAIQQITWTTYERIRSRESARAAELSRRLGHCLADPARAATGDLAVRAGVSTRHGLEPDCGLVGKASCPALRQCDPADACVDSRHHHHYRVRDSAAGPANP